jgi:hypothetical protein
VRSDRVVVLAPLLDDDLRFFQAVEDFSIQQLIAELCSDIPASRQATGVAFPCAIETSIWRSSVTICSALNRFFGMTQAPFQAQFLTSLGLKKPSQVTWHSRSDYRLLVPLPARFNSGGILLTRRSISLATCARNSCKRL